MKKRTQGRDYAVKLMYSFEMAAESVQNVEANFLLEYPEESEDVRLFAHQLFEKACDNRKTDETTIRQFITDKWSYERLGVLERVILHLAVAELFNGDAPVYAIMNDYVGLAKNYGDDKSASFINGILENIRVKFAIERGNEKKVR